MKVNNLRAIIPQHNWAEYNWGSGLYRDDRLFQGPFADADVRSKVVMVNLPSKEIIPNYGMGLMNYVIGDLKPIVKPGETVRKSIENIISLPMGQKIYIRPTWRQMQSKQGALDFFEHWEITLELAEKYGKQVGFRIMLNNPDIAEDALPDFILNKVPMFTLEGSWPGDDPTEIRHTQTLRVPHYHNDYFFKALTEFESMMAEKYNGHPLIEFVDTYMYGFWGEGHTEAFDSNPFPDMITAQNTWVKIFEMQNALWNKVPLISNTQPDCSYVGNAEILDRTVRSGNWIRTDTIFIENQQIDAISNRPPWIGAALEAAISHKGPENIQYDNGSPVTEYIIEHVKDVGANYWSVWNWHAIHRDNVLGYYEKHPETIDELNRVIGYRVRPSWIWFSQLHGYPSLIVGFVNDGIAGVPGVMRVSVVSGRGEILSAGTLDPGYPTPSGVRQARLVLPKDTAWEGLILKAEIIVKGVARPLRFACREANADGSVTLRKNSFLD